MGGGGGHGLGTQVGHHLGYGRHHAPLPFLPSVRGIKPLTIMSCQMEEEALRKAAAKEFLWVLLIETRPGQTEHR